MDTAQINSPRFSYQTAAPAAPRTLNDMRIIPDYHDPVSTFSAKKAMLPALITALVVVGIAGTAIGLHRYSENTAEKINAPAETSTPIVAPAPAPAPVTKDAVTEPLGPVIKSEEVAPPVITPKVEVAKPVVKPVPPKAAPAPVKTVPAAATEATPPAREATPPSPPVAEPVVVPPPAPVVEPAPTTPPEPPKQ